jgi:hypothetical protein
LRYPGGDIALSLNAPPRSSFPYSGSYYSGFIINDVTLVWPASLTQGGDQRSARIEAHAPLILGMVEKTPDVTLGELRAALAEQGVGAGVATL